MMKRGIFSGIILGTFVACIMAATPLMAQSVHEEVTRTPTKTLSKAEESAISSAAVHVLRQIAKARGAIHDKNLDQAKKDLGKAMVLIQMIKVSLPTMKVKDHIWVAKKHLDYESTEEVLPDLAPIYDDLAEIEDIVPVSQAKKHIDNAKKALKKGDKESAKKSLQAANKALVYVEVDLPLSSTERHIISAETMLSKDKPHDADMQLKAAEDSVQFASVVLEAPLTKAKKSLWHAFKDYAARRSVATVADLNKAEGYLKKAAQSTDKKTREEAGKLEKDVKALKGKLKTGGKHTRAEIKGLWERSKALSEREADRISTGWQTFHSKNAAKKELIEAKLHLEYAEIYQFTTSESNKTGAEIGKAETYLKSAERNAGSEARTKIDAIAQKLSQIKAGLTSKKEAAKDRYEKVKTDLRELIRDL